jgi:hypothetical protein
MERSRKIDSCCENKTVEPGALEMSFCDSHAHHAFARAVSRRGIEVTGATKRTIAVLDPFAFETPVSSHGTPPVALSDRQLDYAAV